LTRTDSATTTRRPARTQESGKINDDMDEKDDEIAHLLIVTKPGIACGCATNQQFARNTLKKRIILHGVGGSCAAAKPDSSHADAIFSVT
jgi:hypothetical protein